MDLVHTYVIDTSWWGKTEHTPRDCVGLIAVQTHSMTIPTLWQTSCKSSAVLYGEVLLGDVVLYCVLSKAELCI